jgi:hypothetical protein
LNVRPATVRAEPIRSWPARFVAATINVSEVDVSPSTVTALNVLPARSRTMACSARSVTQASVKT